MTTSTSESAADSLIRELHQIRRGHELLASGRVVIDAGGRAPGIAAIRAF